MAAQHSNPWREIKGEVVVLVQNSKGGGLASGFSSSNQIMGVRKTTDVLEKLTWGLAIALMVFSITGTMLIPRGEEAQSTSVIQEQIDNAALPANQSPLSNQPAPAETAPAETAPAETTPSETAPQGQ